jgi:hypothetical protein
MDDLLTSDKMLARELAGVVEPYRHRLDGYRIALELSGVGGKDRAENKERY